MQGSCYPIPSYPFGRTGSFASLPAKMNHFAWMKGRTVVQVHGTGPFAITYVNPSDDPRNAKTQ